MFWVFLSKGKVATLGLTSRMQKKQRERTQNQQMGIFVFWTNDWSPACFVFEPANNIQSSVLKYVTLRTEPDASECS